jgi:hypothetical protein
VARERTAYLLAFEEFESSLSAQDRAALGRAAAPELEDHKAHSTKRVVLGAIGDAAERSAASYLPDLAGALDGDAECLAERAGISLTQAEVIYAYMREKIERESAAREAAAIVTIAAAFLKGANAKLLAAGLGLQRKTWIVVRSRPVSLLRFTIGGVSMPGLWIGKDIVKQSQGQPPHAIRLWHAIIVEILGKGRFLVTLPLRQRRHLIIM